MPKILCSYRFSFFLQRREFERVKLDDDNVPKKTDDGQSDRLTDILMKRDLIIVTKSGFIFEEHERQIFRSQNN